jgi:hypothetical protein
VYQYARDIRKGGWEARVREAQVAARARLFEKSPQQLEHRNRKGEQEAEGNIAISIAHVVTTENKQSTSDPYAGSIYTFLAEAKIRLAAGTRDLEYALEKAQWLTKSFLVPNYKTINAILMGMIRVYNQPVSTPRVTLALHQKSSFRSTIRNYSTAVTTPGIPDASNDFLVRPRMGSWQDARGTWEKTMQLATISRLLNHHNIHFSTIRLLARLATTEAELEIPWQVAQRAKHPKTIFRRTQKALMEAACKVIPPTPKTRPFRLSKGPVTIMRLERMQIPLSRDVIILAIQASVNDGNIPGARMLMERLHRYGFTLLQNEAAELIKRLPSTGLGSVSTASGEPLSPMYVRMEQLAFITDLRPYITDPAFLGPYVLALGRCGSAVEIWSVWNDSKGQKLKDGIVTAFVEGFILANDLSSAIKFVRVAYREGYPMNFWSARTIAGAIGRGQSGIGLELIREMILQKLVLHEKGTEDLVSVILSSQGQTLRSPSRRLSSGLVRKIMLATEGKDVDSALDELDRILGKHGGETVV